MDALAQIVLSSKTDDKFTFLKILRKRLPQQAIQQLVNEFHSTSQHKEAYFQSEQYKKEQEEHLKKVHGTPDNALPKPQE